jgi:hypothetical protein
MQALILVATKGWSDKLARIGVLRASSRPRTPQQVHCSTSCCPTSSRITAQTFFLGVSMTMTLAIIVFLAFGAGFVVRSFMDNDDASDLSEIERYAGGSCHRYD